ncbi:hypothetical protein [Methanosarcina siciliae]|nr:hypothetical protein [Methanosarcina siciliae]
MEESQKYERNANKISRRIKNKKNKKNKKINKPVLPFYLRRMKLY